MIKIVNKREGKTTFVVRVGRRTDEVNLKIVNTLGDVQTCVLPSGHRVSPATKLSQSRLEDESLKSPFILLNSKDKTHTHK